MEKNTLEGRISVLKEQIHTEEMNEEHLKNRREVISQDLTAKEEQLVSYEKERTHLESQNTEGLERLEEAKKEVQNQEEEIRELEALIDASKAEIIRCLNEKAELAARQQRYEAMLEQVNLRRSEVSQKLLRFKSDESVQEERISQENERLSLVKKELEEKQFAAQEAEDAMTEADKEVRRLNRRLNDTQQEYHMAHTRLESLRNLAERYDGYGNSIRRVMEVRDRIHGIHGVVADLIATRQSYETAIETALGGSIQNIVTDSETTAKQLIEYLKKNKYGRATFLPLTSIGNGQAFPKPEALKEKGVIGLASDLVETKEEYQGLVRYLLGRVVVASDIDAAIALAKKYRYSLRIVTLEGELLSPGGSMTGGAFKNSSNLLGRRREIEELEQACSLHLKQAEIMQTELSLAEAMVQEKKDETQTLKAAAQKLALEENYCKKGWVFMFCDVDGVQFVVPDEIREFTIKNLESDKVQNILGLIAAVRLSMRACLNLFGIVERAKVEDIALNQMLEYPSLSEEERKELEWLPEKLKETVDILCERADGPFWCDEQWIISEQFENEKEYRKFLRQVSGQEYYIPNQKEIKLYAENLVDVKNPFYKKILADLTHLMKNKTRADNLMLELEYRVAEEDLNAAGIMNLLFERYVEFPNRTRGNHFVENCSEWVYSVRKWSNRGFTDRELGKEKIIPSEIGLTEISNQVTKKKIGRNDPCPCGSGKKYKHCCGK